jgi:hypothetical protein
MYKCFDIILPYRPSVRKLCLHALAAPTDREHSGGSDSDIDVCVQPLTKWAVSRVTDRPAGIDRVELRSALAR